MALTFYCFSPLSTCFCNIIGKSLWDYDETHAMFSFSNLANNTNSQSSICIDWQLAEKEETILN
jgi:hypothetical protein